MSPQVIKIIGIKKINFSDANGKFSPVSAIMTISNMAEVTYRFHAGNPPPHRELYDTINQLIGNNFDSILVPSHRAENALPRGMLMKPARTSRT